MNIKNRKKIIFCCILFATVFIHVVYSILQNIIESHQRNNQFYSRLQRPKIQGNVFVIPENNKGGEEINCATLNQSQLSMTAKLSISNTMQTSFIDLKHKNEEHASSIDYNEQSYTTSLVESHGFLKYSDNIWQRKKRLHDWQSKRQHGRQDSKGRVFYQENWEPTWSCDFEQRIGKIGDGGKWLCDAYLIAESKKCNVISIGSNNDWSFEEAIYELNPRCKIFTFDHTINPQKKPDYVTFYGTGLDSKTRGKLGTMDFLLEMAGLSNQVIDILKIDCEGCEWGVYKQLFTGFIRQILIELHGVGPGFKVNDFFTEMDRHGYVIFHKEPNTLGCGGECIEYALLKLNLQPTSIATSYQSYDAERGRHGAFWIPKGAGAERARPLAILPQSGPVMLRQSHDSVQSAGCYMTQGGFGNQLLDSFIAVCGDTVSSEASCIRGVVWESLFMRTSTFCIGSFCPKKSKPYKNPGFTEIYRRLVLSDVKTCISLKFKVNETFAQSLIPENAWKPQCAVHVRFGDGVAFKKKDGSVRANKFSSDKRICQSASLSCFEKILQLLIEKCDPITDIYLATDLKAFHNYASASWVNITSTSHAEVHWNDIPVEHFDLLNPSVESVITDWIALYSANKSYSIGHSTYFDSVKIIRDPMQSVREQIDKVQTGGQNAETNTDKNAKHSPFERTKSMECYDTTHAFGNALLVGMQVVCGASQKHIDSSSQSICLNDMYWESLFSRSSAFCHDATCVVKSTPYQTPEFKKIRKILHIPAVKKCMASKFSVNKSAAKLLVTENAWQPPCAVHARFGDGVAFKHKNGTSRHKKYQEVRLCSPSSECFEKILQRVVKVCAPVTSVYLATDLHSFHEYAIHRKMLNIISIKSDELHIMDIPSKDLHFSNHVVRAAMADWIALFSAKRSYGFGGSTFFESAMILRSHADNLTVV